MLCPVPLDDVCPSGDLLRRAELNFQRLHDAEFHFEAMMTAFTAREAPGDWVGRCLLALILHARLLGRVAPHLEEIIERLPSVLNARGYVGEIHPEGRADENQFGGHNALLRGLCEAYRWRRDPRAVVMIRPIVTNLMVPVQPLFATYPDRLRSDLMDNQLVGLTVPQTAGAWVGLSTDVNAGFGALDGLTQACAVAPAPGLRALINTMIERYAAIDPMAVRAQTHSTLSALRGILRWWRDADPRPQLLEFVRGRFQLYCDEAETEHHANYNWFGRPEWTEPCAIVDAFLLAVQLWAAGGGAELLEEAHRIYYNSLAHAQRPNGGYGCDVCTGANGELHVAAHRFFEAPWCCSMRGAEGLARAAQYGWFTEAETIVLPFYFGGSARLVLADGEVAIEEDSAYPLAGEVRLRVTSSTLTRQKTLKFFAPSWSPAERFEVARNGRPLAVTAREGFAVVEAELCAGDEISVGFPVEFSAVSLQNPARQPGHRRFAHGPLLLGHAAAAPVAIPVGADFVPLGAGRYRAVDSGLVLEPVRSLLGLSEDEARARRTQLVFPCGADRGRTGDAG
jgi:uncharacterized protein